jgi:hypothetical protein
MLERALGLRAPKLVGGDPDLAEGVGFYAKFAHRLLLNAAVRSGGSTADMATELRNVQFAREFGTRAGSR